MNNREIIKAFRQGGTGNCVSIAIIKASIEIFGLENVFQSNWVENTCNIIMRDGFELSITKEELQIGIDNSRFIQLENKEIFDFANIAFTAMAKRAQMEDNDNQEDMSFEEAIESLNKGEFYLEGPHWLGLRHHIRSSGRRYIWQYKGIIGASRAHCFYVSKGLEDNYGKVDKIKIHEKRFCKWFRIDSQPVF